MTQWTYLVVIGLAAMAIGFGVLSGLEIKDLKINATAKPVGVIFGLIGFICLALGILGTIGLLERQKEPEPSSSPSPPSSTSAAPSPNPSTPSTSSSQLPFSVTLHEPEDGATAPLGGTRVSGAVKGDIGDSTLWLFIYSDGGWYLTKPFDPAIDGSFEVDSGQVGEQNEKGKVFRLEVLVTDPGGTQKINRRQADGDVVFQSRPGHLAAKTRITRV
jgi:hypothetical protein